MSLNKSATRRLSLLAGSSLVAASLSATLSLGAALAPTAALAYDECTPTAATGTLTDGIGGASDPTLNGGTADDFSCTAATYATGITYSSDGNLTLRKTSGGVNTTTIGIDLTGNGADTVTWISAGVAGGPVGGAGPVGPLIDVTTSTGAISITASGVVGASRTGTTHGIRAISGNIATATPGGDITISSGTQTVNNNGVDGQIAVEAVTNGGNIIFAGAFQGQRRGIVARTNGAGAVALTVRSATVSAVDGIVAIDVTAGTGGITIITGTGGGGTIDGGAGGLAIRAETTGSATITHGIGVMSGAVDLSKVALGATLTVQGGSRWEASGASSFGGGNDVLNLFNIQTNRLADGGSISFGAGDDTFALRQTFTAGAGTIDFGTGDDRLSIVNQQVTLNGTTVTFGDGADVLDLDNSLTGEDAVLNFGAGDDTFNFNGSFSVAGATIDFADGDDTLNLTSTLTVRDLTIVNVEAFNSTGVLLMGGQGGATTNLAPGDVLSLAGATFTGSGASRIVMDVNFAAGGQEDCSSPTAADCLDFTGGGTAGSTLLTIRDAGGSSTAGSSSRTTIVVGATEAGNFTLDPNSSGYVVTDQGPALRKRLFDYYLLYDPDELKYVFAAAPHIEAFQFATFAASAQDIWRSTTGSWFDRQADLRATPGGIEPSRGLWARGGAGVAERDAEIPLDVLGTAFLNEVSYSQRTSHLAFGADLLGAVTQGSAWVVGITGGLMRSDVEYEAPSVEAIYAGVTGGLYASVLAGPFFLDATVNANVVDAESDVPSLGFDGDVKLSQAITSVGAQMQAGWRFAVGETMFAEPLVSVSYVETELDEIEVPGDAGTITFDEGAKSLRVGGGLRVGLDSELMGQAASFSLTGRYWNELEGENGTGLTGNAPTLLVDDYSGSFGEVTGSLNLYSSEGGVSGFVNLGGRFADGYQSIDGSVGVRVRW